MDGESQRPAAPMQDMPNQEVTMVRGNMLAIPQFALPAGYCVRMYRDGDAATWTALQAAAEPFFAIAPDLFDGQYGDALDALPDRMFFIETDNGEPAASISAWWETDRFGADERGRIHWVVVHPDHQKRGLTKPMMTLAMARLAQSHTTAMLGTSTGRVWAIKVYLDFGFAPDLDEIMAKPEVASAWRALQARLAHPLLADALARAAGMSVGNS